MRKSVLIAVTSFVFVLFGAVLVAIYVTDEAPTERPNNPFLLKDKTEREIESLYGLPVSEGILFDGKSPTKKYRISKGVFIDIHYSNGIARGTHFEIPLQWQTNDLVNTLKNCGLADFAELGSQPNRGQWTFDLPDHTTALISVNKIESGYISCDVDF